MDTTLLPLAATARLLHVESAWLKSEADAGRVPCLRANDRYLFVLEVVEQELAARAAKERVVTDAK